MNLYNSIINTVIVTLVIYVTLHMFFTVYGHSSSNIIIPI